MRRGFLGVFCVIFGGILPFIAIFFAYQFGMHYGNNANFVNPVPTWWHTACIMLVGVVNIWGAVMSPQDPLIMADRFAELSEEEKALRLLARLRMLRCYLFLNAIVIIISATYACAFAAITPFALFAVIIWGLGLLPLAPLLALLVALILRYAIVSEYGSVIRSMKANPSQPNAHLTSSGSGALWLTLLLGGTIGLAMLVAPEIHQWRYKYLIRTAVRSPNSELRAKSIEKIRSFRDQKQLLDLCYGYDRIWFLESAFNMNLQDAIMDGWDRFDKRSISPEEAQMLYYIITGESYRDQPAVLLPEMAFARQFDVNQGTEEIGGIQQELKLIESEIEANCWTDAQLATMLWTIVFENQGHVTDREARMQVQLPPGGCVSRATLWINGEPREAAFGSSGQVREAYESVVQRNRDPLLVTSCGEDRVQVQCFPVQPDSEMKIRLGITMPLPIELQSTDGVETAQACLTYPQIVSRNFVLADTTFKSVACLNSASESDPESLTEDAEDSDENPQDSQREMIVDNQPQSLAEGIEPDYLPIDILAQAPSGQTPGESVQDVQVALLPQPCWSPDPFDQSQVIVQSFQRTRHEPPERIVVVIDGSRLKENVSLREASESAINALAKLAPDSTDLCILVAGDDVHNISNEGKQGDIPQLDDITQYGSPGGCDNIPALNSAVQMAAEIEGDIPILWIHATQPVLVSKPNTLERAVKRYSGSFTLYDIPIGVCENRILQDVAIGDVVHMPPGFSSQDELLHLIDRIAGQRDVLVPTWKAIAQTDFDSSNDMTQTNDQLARLWAKEQVQQLLASDHEKSWSDAVRLATTYRIVTSCSGAVVLENRAQYDANDLLPPDYEELPTVPEPEFWLMLLLVVVLLTLHALWRRRQLSPLPIRSDDNRRTRR